METAFDVEQEGANGRTAGVKTIRKFADTVGQRFGVANASELADKVDAQTRQAYSTVRTQVQSRPGVAVGVAAGAGLLIGLMLSRR